MEAENERDRQVRGGRNHKDRLLDMEKDRKDLADEYVVLKTNYLALVREHEKEVRIILALVRKHEKNVRIILT